MKKNHSIALGLVAILVLSVAGSYYWHKTRGRVSSTAENKNVGSEQTIYAVSVDSLYSTEQQVDVVLKLEGKLLVHEQGDGQLVSEWDSLTQFTVMNDEVAAEPILHSPAVTIVEKGEMKHFIDPTFPSDYWGLQKELLSRFFIPIPVRISQDLYRSEREYKEFFRVEYQISQNKKGYEALRSWIQNLQGDVQADPKLNGFRYQYSPAGKLVSMQGTLTLKGVDEDNLPFQLTTKIFLNKTGREKLASGKRVYHDRRAMVIAEPVPTRDPDDPEPLRPLSEVFAGIGKLSASDEPQVRTDLYIELARNLVERPSSLDDIKAKILSMPGATDQDKYQQDVLFSVLSESETPASSNVLADLFASDCKTDFCREMAISAYEMHSNTTLESAQKVLRVALTDTALNVSLSAYLGAGEAGRILGDRFAELRPSLANAAKAADKAKDTPSKAVIVRAIGNTGDRKLLPILQESLKSEDLLTRNTSFFALRFIPGQDVNKLLVNALSSEKNELTTTEIVRSASYRQFSKAEYEKIGEKVPEWEAKNADLAMEMVSLLLSAYHRNPEDAQGVLESLKGKVVPELKQFIEDGMNPLGATSVIDEDKDSIESDDEEDDNSPSEDGSGGSDDGAESEP
jgi:hypothetical protein